MPVRGETRRLIVRLPLVILATRISERPGGRRLRGSVPNHLGQEYFRLGIRALQVSPRANLLLPRRWPQRSLVWRQIAVNALGRGKTCSQPTPPNDEARRADRARIAEQQQVRGHCGRSFRRLWFHADRVRTA